MKNLRDSTDELNIEYAKSLSKKGIDVFNVNDSFFNDLCHKYDNLNGKDIILKDRRNDYYQNMTFCQNGCTYNGMNYELTTANCLCDTSSMQEEYIIENYNKEKSENLNFKTMAKTFTSNLLDFNIDVIFCYNLIFDFQRLIKNIGFYIMFIMLVMQIIFLSIFLIKKLKPIFDFILKFNNPMKNKKQTLPLTQYNYINKNDNS